MELNNLTLEEINQLLIDAGETVQVDSSEFVQVNASNESQYVVTYEEGSKTNHVFVYDLEGTPELNFADFDEDEGEPADDPQLSEEELALISSNK